VFWDGRFICDISSPKNLSERSHAHVFGFLTYDNNPRLSSNFSRPKAGSRTWFRPVFPARAH
jgi:hypothetical protein